MVNTACRVLPKSVELFCFFVLKVSYILVKDFDVQWHHSFSKKGISEISGESISHGQSGGVKEGINSRRQMLMHYLELYFLAFLDIHDRVVRIPISVERKWFFRRFFGDLGIGQHSAWFYSLINCNLCHRLNLSNLGKWPNPKVLFWK